MPRKLLERSQWSWKWWIECSILFLHSSSVSFVCMLPYRLFGERTKEKITNILDFQKVEIRLALGSFSFWPIGLPTHTWFQSHFTSLLRCLNWYLLVSYEQMKWCLIPKRIEKQNVEIQIWLKNLDKSSLCFQIRLEH